jgi:hypothetical protein
MLRDVGGRGFPTIALLSPEGELIGKHNGPRNVAGFTKTIESASGLVSARAKVAEGDKAAMTDVLLYEMRFGMVTSLDAAKKRFEGLEKVSPEQKKELEGLMAGIEFSELMDQREELAEGAFETKVMEMYKAGRIPTGDKMVDFWFYGILQPAQARKDAEMATKAVEVLGATEIFKDPRNKKMLDEIREEIAGYGK